MKEKELKKELERLKKNGLLIVGVYQNKDDEYNAINKTVLKNIWKDEKTNIIQLLGFLYRKAILKSNIRISYSYNYNDVQEITISESFTNYDGSITKTKYVFYNVPTNMSYLDTFKIEKIIESLED